MPRKELMAKICSQQIVGVVREDRPEDAAAVADAYAKHGIRILEITLTTPDAFELIANVSRRYAGDDVTIAAGTVRSSNDAAMARRAGAEIIVSPHTDVRVIEYANENDMLTIAGAATATEIIHAWEAGCDIVKIFPAPQLGGADYIRAIRGPIRDIPLLAGGPVSLDAIDSFLDAGCVAVNLGVSLAVPDLVRMKQWEEIGRRVILATSIINSRKNATPAESAYIH
jgi:2-dehydro-3-deoxyphosphogluconate aldolase/(4S)-4-hydroxy-2-oxoglutarate aldolase